MDKDRYERGMRKLKEIDGEAGEKVIESLNDIAPDLARYTIEFPFGDIYSRPGRATRSQIEDCEKSLLYPFEVSLSQHALLVTALFEAWVTMWKALNLHVTDC
jgi:hypothetical protein